VFLTACLVLGLFAAEASAGLPAEASMPDMLTVSSRPLPSVQDSQTVLLGLINHERRQAGLRPLIWDDRLAEAARDHAEVMSREGRLSHQFEGEPDLLQRLTQHSLRLDAASENVVYDVSAEGAHEAFAKSLPHRANMLNASFDGVGIAVVNQNGILYVVEDFAHRIVDLSDEAATLRVSDRFAGLREGLRAPALEFVEEPRALALVEQMAAREMPDGRSPLSLPGARSAASYATTSPDEIPASVAALASLRGVSSYTVGVRFVRTPKYPSGLFWVSIVLFGDNATLHASNRR